MPEAYYVIRAARYLGVAPWDLAQQPRFWLDFALCCEYAESRAPEIAEAFADQKAKVQGG